MTLPARTEATPVRPTDVLCAACASRFESGSAGPGDRVRCPLCGEEVEVAGLVTERRRRRRRPQPAAGHLPRRAARRAVVRLLAVAAALGLGAWLWSSWEPVSAWVADAARAALGRDNPR